MRAQRAWDKIRSRGKDGIDFYLLRLEERDSINVTSIGGHNLMMYLIYDCIVRLDP